ncbi:TPA: hypothetical protein ACHBXQ_005481 [Klebsiella variicola subsp. variicola]
MQLEDYISAGRLNIYTDVLKLKPGEELGGYNWNKAVSAAMQPLMHCLEVTLRNAIDYSIRHARLPGCPALPDTGEPIPTGSLIYPAISVTRPGYARTSATKSMPVARSSCITGNRFMTGQPGKKTVSVRCQNVSVLRARRRRQSG